MAIFKGQIASALAAGNAVLAKPAEPTPLIANYVSRMLHQAGVPRSTLQILVGNGAVGAALTRDAQLNGVAFTGSMATARYICNAMATNLHPGAPLIAEPGEIIAMTVDSTALPEQAVASIVESAFQSASQRCSAMRRVYVQDDIAAALTAMLIGTMQKLFLGDP